ncbi:hypothetical protein MGYG_02837 [Nannizzia gypsea CBS 118893]|uniref:SWR1-complex protein 3 domain-containing protein n=1 Tax=Arthroderma gypseum (strain ATCC MYA-4604 / CBS 118893) TaxID=535722 RepID=E4UP99_ARTGP|nr:hypothetical protein MGYG_02837 [Nannizzia gypsea CBS 118893]EFQ99825.1 hypothetical protein MGYG_02837 [Nannizzia gypsea CBS 118893]
MAEKRKQPGPGKNRGGRPRKKRLEDAAEASPSPKRQRRKESSATPSKKATVTPVPSLPVEPPAEETLPTKISENQTLPTLPRPQTQGSLSDYQSYAESGVITAALHRSRTRWLHDCLFEKYWTKPSKKKNQPQPTFQNPPKDSMTKLGPCTMVIEPHYFDIMLYTVRRPQSQQPNQQQQQKSMAQLQYTPPSNSNQFHEYNPRLPAAQAPPNRPSNAVPAPQAPQQPQQQYQHHQQQTLPPPPPQPPTQQQRQPPPLPQNPPISQTQKSLSTNPPPPGPVHQPPPSHPHGHNAPQRPPNPPPGKPSTDPVIQLLANRAATNPDLRALMRIVADSQADQEQLRAFQAHIDEINAIIASRNSKDSQPNQPPAKPNPPAQQAAHPTPTGVAQNQGPTPIASRNPAAPPGPVPYHPQNQHQNPHPPGILYGPGPPGQQGTHPIKAKHTQKVPPPHSGSFRPHYSQPVSQPARIDIKSVVFEFILPAGSNNGPTGDRYLFPENMILDFFPGNTTVIASFLAIKKIGPPGSSMEFNKKAPVKVRGKKAKLLQTAAASNPSEGQPNTPAPQLENEDTKDADIAAGEDSKAADAPSTPNTAPSPSGTKPKAKESNVKEYYQPVTLRLHANNPRTLEPLGRVVKSPSEVRDYMNNVMDKIERADIEYLAFRLPRYQRRGPSAATGDEIKPIGPTRGSSKHNGAEDESGVATPRAVDRGNGGSKPVEEEVLQNHYDLPSGLVPLRA